MRIPKASTIRGKINAYAYKVGITIVKNTDGSYNLWDMVIGYTTHRNINMDTVVRVVIDEMYARKYRQEREASLNMGVWIPITICYIQEKKEYNNGYSAWYGCGS